MSHKLRNATSREIKQMNQRTEIKRLNRALAIAKAQNKPKLPYLPKEVVKSTQDKFDTLGFAATYFLIIGSLMVIVLYLMSKTGILI